MNPNLFVVTTDWHVVSDDSEVGGVGETHPTDAAAVSSHIASLDPAGCIDMGDCKDHYGSSTGDEHDNYISRVRGTLPYSDVLDGANATLPILPGNHDEVDDYDTPGSVTDFSIFNSHFWGAPYHWQVNWEAAKVRFIAVHSYTNHATDGFGGYAHIDTTEIDWLQDRIDETPANWQVIVCSHFPAYSGFGTYIRFVDGTWNSVAYTNMLADNAGRICAYLNGHRHQNMNTAVVNGIPHFSCPGMAYSIGNSYGGFVPITYDPDDRTLSFDFLYGPPHPGGYTRFSGYAPLEVQLPLGTKLAKVRAAA